MDFEEYSKFREEAECQLRNFSRSFRTPGFASRDHSRGKLRGFYGDKYFTTAK
jgi:hypothetical protein